jgi:hypothetical protein
VVLFRYKCNCSLLYFIVAWCWGLCPTVFAKKRRMGAWFGWWVGGAVPWQSPVEVVDEVAGWGKKEAAW